MTEFMDTALTAVIGAGLGWYAHTGWIALQINGRKIQHKAGFVYAYECYEKGCPPEREKVRSGAFMRGLNDGMASIVQGEHDPEKLKAMGVKIMKGELE